MLTHPPTQPPVSRRLPALRLLPLLTFLLILYATPSTARAAGPLYATPTGAGSCSTWADACTLQAALTTATDGDEIWVQAGLHKPATIADRHATFTLKNGVSIYGGFAGTETLREQRDPVANVTTLSGDIGTPDDMGDNSYHVVTGSGTASTALLDGFTITAGNANGLYAAPCGLMCGGGMTNNNGSPTLTNVIFSANNATYGGGMSNLNGSRPTLINVTFSGNTVTNSGGMYNDGSSPTLTNVTFNGNSANNKGGGIYNYDSHPTLTNVTFNGNSAGLDGAAIYNYISSPTLTNVTFNGNSAGQGGGALYNYVISNPTLTNVAFSGNAAGTGGGGIYNYNSSPTLTNVTFSGNRAGSAGGGIYNDNSSFPIRNTIFWNNQDGSGIGTATASLANSTSTPTISYSLVQGCYPGGAWQAACGTDGGHNLPVADPLFILTPNPALAPTTGDLRLQAGSPAIDAGNSAVASATDLDGTPRIQGAAVDLGPYESGAATCTAPLTPAVTISLTGTPPTDVLLGWAAGPADDGYNLYRSTQPYFDPAITPAHLTLPAGTTAYTDPAPATPTFYTIRALGTCGDLSPWQTPLGQFSFTLVPGS